MKIIIAIVSSLTLLFTGLFLFFMLNINSTPGAFNYPASNISETNRQAIAETLKAFQDGYESRDVSYYDVGWFPFCITAPIALFCIFVILRFFYLLIFASDERRELVFGDKDYNPF